jgi:hypothetical protein
MLLFFEPRIEIEREVAIFDAVFGQRRLTELLVRHHQACTKDEQNR